jgi:hypothetical protein
MDPEPRNDILQSAIELAALARRNNLDFLGYLLDLVVLEARSHSQQAIAPLSPAGFADAAYLRTQASRCMRMAKECRELPISHDLEEIGMDMTAKATGLEGFLASQKKAG